MQIRLSLPGQKYGLLTEQKTKKVRRKQIEITEHRARQPIDYWGHCVKDEHRGGIRHQEADSNAMVNPGDHEKVEQNLPTGPFHGTSLTVLCSRTAAWTPMISVPHIPS